MSKICEVHFKADCPLCSPHAAPVPPEVRDVAPAPPPPVAAGSQPVAAPPKPAAPEITDPEALKLFKAAESYAETVKQVAILTDQVKNAKDMLEALQEKLTDTKKMAAEALKTMQGASK